MAPRLVCRRRPAALRRFHSIPPARPPLPSHPTHHRCQVAALHAAIRDVCALACAVEADSDRFPQDWLFHVR